MDDIRELIYDRVPLPRVSTSYYYYYSHVMNVPTRPESAFNYMIDAHHL